VVHERLQHVVLDLLIDHHAHYDDRRRRHALRQRDRGDDHRPDRCADEWDEIEDRDDDAQRHRIRNVRRDEDHNGDAARDQADEDVA
jgi:hypothetical protein